MYKTEGISPIEKLWSGILEKIHTLLQKSSWIFIRLVMREFCQAINKVYLILNTILIQEGEVLETAFIKVKLNAHLEKRVLWVIGNVKQSWCLSDHVISLSSVLFIQHIVKVLLVLEK